MFGTILASVATSLGGSVLQKVAKKAVTKLSAAAAQPVLEEFFTERLTQKGRAKLGRQLVAVGKALEEDLIEEASEGAAEIIEGVKI